MSSSKEGRKQEKKLCSPNVDANPFMQSKNEKAVAWAKPSQGQALDDGFGLARCF
jgi:hypothetical protein